MEHNPRKLFYRLFGEGDTAAEREAIIAQTGSLLDLVTDSACPYARELGAADQRASGSSISTPCARSSVKSRRWPIRTSRRSTLPDAPAGVPAAFDDHINTMFDLTALAYQAGLTRVVSFMMAAEISMLTYNQVGVSEAFHPLSHHQNNRTSCRGSRSCKPITPTVFAGFLDKLATRRTGTARCWITRSCCTAAT